jgi:hypothetical protein
MKGLKFAIAGAGVLGLLAMFIPIEIMPGLSASLFAGRSGPEGWRVWLTLAGFLVPVIVAVLGITKPPFKAVFAGVALAGFAATAVAFQIWETLPKIGDMPGVMKLLPIATVLGIIVSGLALAKPEE